MDGSQLFSKASLLLLAIIWFTLSHDFALRTKLVPKSSDKAQTAYS